MLTICSLALSPTTTNNVRSFSFTPFSTSVRIRESTFFLILLLFLLAVVVVVVFVVDYEQRFGLKSEEFIGFGVAARKKRRAPSVCCAGSLSHHLSRARCCKTNSNNTQT